MIIRRIGHAAVHVPVATVHYNSSKTVWGRKVKHLREGVGPGLYYGYMCFLCPHAKEEVLLNEIELELKADGIISMYHGQFYSSKSMGQINVGHLREE